MVIYTVEWYTGYDYTDILGYYTTLEKAEEALKEFNKNYQDAYISEVDVI
jgi:hypothetical protein